MRGKPIYQPLRAPRNPGETLIAPPLAALPQLLESNRLSFDSAGADVAGYSLPALRKAAQSEVIQLAVDYTTSYRDIQFDDDSRRQAPLVLSGHQPQLFHPGVWFKNFALATCWNLPAVALNIIIDNDICLRPSIRVPRGSVENPQIEVFSYDSSVTGLPFEERRVRDEQVFCSFGERVTEAIQPLVPEPLLRKLWPLARKRFKETDNLGLCVSQARHKMEEQWNLNTLELPLSKICQTPAFRVFTIHLLSHCERLRADYNGALAEYRRVNRIRSRSHPVPELIAEDGYFETPFWIWTNDQPVRRRLFARLDGTGLRVTDRNGIVEEIAAASADVSSPVERLAELEVKRGIKIRPRALTTTMFGRFVLSDMFFHGIGGAKYDQLTDEIIRRFFSCEPPAFLTITATVHLPLELPSITEEDVRTAAQNVRESKYHPEKFIDNAENSNEVAALLQEKKYWVGQSLPRGQRGSRHRAIERINGSLRRMISDRREKLIKTHDELRETLRRKSILASREFSFCLFPKKSFEELLLELS